MDFDSNTWYRLTTAAAMGRQLSLTGLRIGPDDGLVACSGSDNDAPSQQWQLFPVGLSTYVLRTKASGPHGYLTIASQNESDIPISTTNVTISQISNSSIKGNMYWTLLPWGDGTFYFAGQANSSRLHLDFNENGRLSMTSNITQPQPGQAFSFVKVGKVEHTAFSTVDTPLPSPTYVPDASINDVSPNRTLLPHPPSSFLSAPTSASTVPPASTSTTTSLAPTKTSEPVDAESLGLSTSASMGIGAAVTVCSIITAICLGLLFYTRWKRRNSPTSLHYRRAKLWKGFTPQAPPAESLRALRAHKGLSLREEKALSGAFVVELPVHPSPSAHLTPAIPASPFTPFTPSTPFTPLTFTLPTPLSTFRFSSASAPLELP